MGSLELTYHSARNGFCSVNYTALNHQGQKLFYCMQLTFGKNFGLFRCSKDWEPDHEIELEHIKEIDLPHGDTTIEDQLTEFLSHM